MIRMIPLGEFVCVHPLFLRVITQHKYSSQECKPQEAGEGSAQTTHPRFLSNGLRTSLAQGSGVWLLGVTSSSC